MDDQNKIEKKIYCCKEHPMYDTVLCDRKDPHEGLHQAYYQGETLHWGIPTYSEMYDVKRTKE